MATGKLASGTALELAASVSKLEEKILDQDYLVKQQAQQVSSLQIENAEKKHWLNCRTKQLTAAEKDVSDLHRINANQADQVRVQREANAGHLKAVVALGLDFEAEKDVTKNLRRLLGDEVCTVNYLKRKVKKGAELYAHVSKTLSQYAGELASAKNRIVGFEATINQIDRLRKKADEQNKAYKAQVRDHQNTIDEQRKVCKNLRSDLARTERECTNLVEGIEELHEENEKLADVQYPAFHNPLVETEFSFHNIETTTSVRLDPISVAFGNGRYEMNVMKTSQRARRKVAARISQRVYKAVVENLNTVFDA